MIFSFYSAICSDDDGIGFYLLLMIIRLYIVCISIILTTNMKMMTEKKYSSQWIHIKLFYFSGSKVK